MKWRPAEESPRPQSDCFIGDAIQIEHDFVGRTNFITHMEIKIHTERFWRCHDLATTVPCRVVSLIVGARRLFFKHEIVVDKRGTHYGHTQETLVLLSNPNVYKRLRKQFVRRETFDDEVVKALEASITKSLLRGGRGSRWVEVKRGRCSRLEY